jgi:hypothetical protein
MVADVPDDQLGVFGEARRNLFNQADHGRAVPDGGIQTEKKPLSEGEIDRAALACDGASRSDQKQREAKGVHLTVAILATAAFRISA